MKGTLTIAGREFRSYFHSPLAYVVICLSMALLGFFFFWGVGPGGGFWEIDRASFDRMFQYSAMGLTILIIPVITMRLLAEEKHSGTLEMLITLPVKDSEVILGKYLGAMGLVLVLIAATLLYPITMFVWPWHLGALDWGPVWTGYLGLVLLAAASVSLGLMISSFTESQTVAFFVTFVVLLMFMMVGRVGDMVHGSFGQFLRTISFDTNLSNFARGLIDTRNVVYFVSITAIALVLAFRSLESRKWR